MKRILYLANIFLFSLSVSAQIPEIESLLNLAKAYQEQKEYLKAIECHESIIELIKPFDNNNITNIVRGTIAINYINLGSPLLKAEKFAEAKPYFDKALEYASDDPKVLPRANSWMGEWYSSYALKIRSNKTNLQQAADYSVIAEKYFNLAGEHNKVLKEMICRSSVLADLSQTNEARTLLQSVIDECERVSDKTQILTKALYELGTIELSSENYQSAILHLERCYTLSLESNHQTASLAAQRLLRLYESQIPDSSKADLWRKRVAEFNIP